MLIEKNYFLLCDNFFVDDKQKPSIVGIYDNIWGPQFPVMHAVMKYAASVKVLSSASSKKIKVRLKLESDSGNVVFESPVQEPEIMPKQDAQDIGVVFEVQNVVFPEEGSYTATLTVNGDVIAAHVVQVRKVPQPEA